MPCSKLARCPSLPIRGSVVAYPQVARTGEHLAWLLPGQVTLLVGDSWSPRLTRRPVRSASGGPIHGGPQCRSARHRGASCRYGTQAAGSASPAEIEPAKNQGIERGNRTRNNNSGGDTKILNDVLSLKWLRFRICSRDVSRRPSGSRQQTLWTCDTCVQTETLQCSRFCPC